MEITKTKMIDVLKSLYSSSDNDVNRDILTNAVDRLNNKGTLTPKQAVWCLKYMTDHDVPLTVDIVKVTEKEATLPEQKTALASLKSIMEGISVIDSATAPVNKLFDWNALDDIESTVESLLKQIKALKE
jgi:hypothetical protein